MSAWGDSGLGLGGALGIILLALAADAAFGGLPLIRQILRAPLAAVEGAAGWLEARLNRARRGPATRRIRGLLVVLVLAAIAWIAGLAVIALGRETGQGAALQLAALLFLVDQRTVVDTARRVRRALRAGDSDGARAALAAGGSGGDVRDDHGAARGAIELLAGAASQRVLSPVLWFLVLGLPGACAVRAVDAMHRRIGGLTPGRRDFGMAASRLDALLSLVPAAIAALFIAIATIFVPTARPGAAIAAIRRDAGRHPSPGEGWPMAAVAGALGLALGGPGRRGGEPVELPWIGDGRARATPQDVGLAIYLFAVACVINGGVLALLVALTNH